MRIVTLFLGAIVATGASVPSSGGRRALLRAGCSVAASSLWLPPSGIVLPASAATRLPKGAKGPTNEICRTVNGIHQKRLGGGDIIVSEMGLGTQRWGSGDFNGPDEALCHKLMDRAILEGGINLIDTAEQYPIPGNPGAFSVDGDTERIIGSWLQQDKSRRERVVLASKITGGRNVNAANIIADCEASLKRLGTDYLDVYTLHWPARYSPQSNWGQSLEYRQDVEQYSNGRASFEEIATAMGTLMKQGKIVRDALDSGTHAAPLPPLASDPESSHPCAIVYRWHG